MHTHFMHQTLALARDALELGEFPIAGLVALDDRVIATATTAENREGRFLVHAELLVLEAADRLGLTIQERRRAILYTNLEPCLMCLGAAMSFFIGQIIYGLESPADGAISLMRDWSRRAEDLPAYQAPDITGGLLREESRQLFAEYAARAPAGPRRDWAASLSS